jgi:GGDEF domain-containing protein
MRGKDTLGRYSGTKFGIVLTECTPDDMAIAADRLLAGVRDGVSYPKGSGGNGAADPRRFHFCPHRCGLSFTIC